MYLRKNDVLIKESISQDDFKRVYKVFRDYPYNEAWPDEEILQEYMTLKVRGKILGAYIEGECIGLISYYDMIKGEHPINYSENLKVLYFSDVAVLPEFRGRGIATKLLKTMIDDASANSYDVIYMRTMQKDKSMSYNIVVKNGFKVIGGKTENKLMKQTNGEMEADSRIFLEIFL